MLELLARSGTARRCLWTVEGAKAETPGAFIVNGGSAGLGLRLTKEGTVLELDGQAVLGIKDDGLLPPLRSHAGMRERCLPPTIGSEEIAVLDGGFELRRDARAFVEAIVALRQKAGRARLIYAPGMAEPANVALLAYLGVDLVDTALVDHRAALGQLAIAEGALDVAKAPWVPAGSDLVRLNREAMLRELDLIKHMISVGRMREFVELRCHSSPWSVAALRVFDDDHYEHQEQDFAVIGPRFYCNAKQSLVRPDVRRFRELVQSRFLRPAHRKVLLLIPCSAKKPYYTSKSHQLFRQVLWEVPNSQVVQEMIITSPLGTVPRELELFYPAAQYDIPVTGHWDREEQAMVRSMALSMATQGYEHVVLHLGEEGKIVREVLDGTVTSAGSPTSAEALDTLRQTLRDLCSQYERVDPGLDRRAAMSSVARFQFGPGGEALLEGARVSGSYPYLKVMRGKDQLGMLSPERGMLSLTIEGAEAILPVVPKVAIGDFDVKGSLFAVGVEDADPAIRAGEEVALVRDGAVAGVGVAMMGGREMVEMRRGEAVKVRHRRR